MKYLVPSDLPAAEKEAGSITLSRFARALTGKKVPKEKTNAVLEKISVKRVGTDGKETTQLKQSLSDEELRDWLKAMKDAADAAGIENKRFEVDIPGEIRKAIDAGLKK
jgi:hypothetical protein